MELFIAAVLGTLFGAALYTSGAAVPAKMRETLRLEDITIIKILLFAIGFSNILIFAANSAGIFNISHLSIKTMNLGVITGGLIFGVGFGMVGSCPGTSFAAMGTGVYKQAGAIAAGGILGALAYSLMYGAFKDMGLFRTLDWGKITLFAVSPKYQSIFANGYIGLLILGILFIAAAMALPDKTGSKG